jgi:hypothetical protein
MNESYVCSILFFMEQAVGIDWALLPARMNIRPTGVTHLCGW